MSGVKELLRSEADGSLSFGDHTLAAKTKLADFKQLVAKYDPQGKFRNAFLDHNLYEG